MNNSDLIKSIKKLEKEIQYLYADYKTMLSRYESYNDIKAVRTKIKHAEESLRLKRRISYIELN